MSDNLNMEKAKEVFSTLIDMLDEKDWKYEVDEEKLLIHSNMNGDDFPITYIMLVDPKHEVVQFLSKLPCEMPEDKIVEGALAVCGANYGLCEGSFDFNLSDGSIFFRLTSNYSDSMISKTSLEHIMFVAAFTVDRYNDRFFLLSKGTINLQQFMEMDNQ